MHQVGQLIIGLKTPCKYDSNKGTTSFADRCIKIIIAQMKTSKCCILKEKLKNMNLSKDSEVKKEQLQKEIFAKKSDTHLISPKL